MAFTNGVATDYKNLMAIMATFAAANGYTILEQSDTRIYLEGPGLAGLDKIRFGCETYEDIANGRYNLSLAGSVGYRAGRALNKHPRSSNKSGSDLVVSYFWNTSIPYWMFITGRRLLVFAKVGTTYQPLHLGLLSPPATDAQCPYPMFIGGAGNTLAKAYSDALGSFWGSYGSSYSSGRIFFPSGAWGTLNSYSANDTSANPAAYPSNICLPDEGKILDSIDGETYMLEPVHIVSAGTRMILGHVEGVFRVSGYKNSSENIINVGGVNHICFQDISRQGYGNFCAVRMD